MTVNTPSGLVELIADLGRIANDEVTHWSSRRAIAERAIEAIADLHSLAQAAGYSEIGEALKAIPVKDAALEAAREWLDDYATPVSVYQAIDAALATPSPPIIDEED